MQITKIKFPVVSFRKIETPVDNTIGKTYITVVDIKNLPEEFTEWRKLNPRDPKITSGVSKKIRESLEENPALFLFKNRGITLLVDKVDFDNQTNMLNLELSDEDRHGLLDGGHTFRIIRDFVDSLDSSESTDAMVKIEILEGIEDKDIAIGIVEARNTSIQVKEQGIQDLKQTFESIKLALKGQSYSDRIAYKEYELSEEGTKKDIDIKEILSYLLCFDVETYKSDNHPIKTYSSKASLVKDFGDRIKEMDKFIKLLPDILELRDKIYLALPGAYNEQGGKFGSLTGVISLGNSKRKSNITLAFTGEESEHKIPSGFIYPVLASFRNLIKIENDVCSWKTNPIDLWEELKPKLAFRVGDPAKEIRNPNKLGKTVSVWQGCYDAVENAALRRNL